MQEKPKIKYIVRICNTDLKGEIPIGHSLNKIKGVSFSFSNAICNALNLEKLKKTGELTEEEIKKIEDVAMNPTKYGIPIWLLNRRKEYETGKDIHIISANLKLQTDFDVKRMKKIKCYKGMRHSFGLPVRGQRTRAHFRHGKALGVQRKKAKIAAAAATPTKEKKQTKK